MSCSSFYILYIIHFFFLLLPFHFCCLACNEYCISVHHFWGFLICHSLVTYQRELLGVCLSESLWYVWPLSWKCQRNTWRDMNCRLRISRLPISSSCGHWHANIYAAKEIQRLSSGCPTLPTALIDKRVFLLVDILFLHNYYRFLSVLILSIWQTL